MKTTALFFIAMSLIINSCSEVKKQVASEELVGKYFGTKTEIIKHSLQNVGMEDEPISIEDSLTVFRDANGDVFLKSEIGKDIKLNGVTFASNGATFSIPEQEIGGGIIPLIKIKGVPSAELDGAKYDGIFFTEKNELKFGYEYVTKYPYEGLEADVIVQCVCEFKKIESK
jgi:hypothetical protein